MIKKPKKARKGIEHLHSLVEQLRFFYQDSDRFKKEVLKKAIYIEDTLYELAVDKKVDHARFATKFKGLLQKEKKELKEEVIELKQTIEELTKENK